MSKSAGDDVLRNSDGSTANPVSESQEVSLSGQVIRDEIRALEQRLQSLEYDQATWLQGREVQVECKHAASLGAWARFNRWPYWKAVLSGIEAGGLLAVSLLAYGALLEQSFANELASIQMLENQRSTLTQLELAREQNEMVQKQMDESERQFESNESDARMQLEMARSQLREVRREFDIGYKAMATELKLLSEQNDLARAQFYAAHRASLISTLYDRKEMCHDMERGTDGRCPVSADIRSREAALISLIDIERSRQGSAASICLDRLDLRNARIVARDLRNVQLRQAFLGGATFNGSNLRRADLSGANLLRANLRNADLTDAIFRGANFLEVSMDGANLTGADFRGATNLAPEQLAGTVIDEGTKLP